MTNKAFLALFLLTFTNLLPAQTAIHATLNKAFTFYEEKQYDSAYKYFTSLKNEIVTSDSFAREIVFGLTASTFFKEVMAKDAGQWDNTIRLATELLNDLTAYHSVMGGELGGKRYYAYKDLVVAYFGLGKKDSAAKYQAILYDAYKNKLLPDGLDQYYNFEKITWKGLNVWGYEWYPNLGDKETEGSFSKQVYYIYSTNANGSDKSQLFRLHTIKIHKLAPGDPKADYVLTYIKSNKDHSESSKTLWDYVFTNPVNYDELHKAVLDFLEKNETQITELTKQ
ncbi:hypothetical protein F5148DRAFT_1154366 [Russula earlei]|uniref:Uncharacterized protein n=1 Tax=Russula earlei TaxID=71964 RepID=A0ACC0TRQ3_9AGAM|nr:hypothetical protein F5148DRAFT_1154366 [Russula earlei]